jgi:hypothetical protein
MKTLIAFATGLLFGATVTFAFGHRYTVQNVGPSGIALVKCDHFTGNTWYHFLESDGRTNQVWLSIRPEPQPALK